MKKFSISEQKPIYEEYYSYFLNKILAEKQSKKCTTSILAKAFNCSKGTISNFENRIKRYDFIMLFKYAMFFNFQIEMFIIPKF